MVVRSVYFLHSSQRLCGVIFCQVICGEVRLDGSTIPIEEIQTAIFSTLVLFRALDSGSGTLGSYK